MDNDPLAAMRSFKELRDLETIPMTRGQLVDLLARVNRAEGMKIEQAEIHARMMIDQYFIEMKCNNSR